MRRLCWALLALSGCALRAAAPSVSPSASLEAHAPAPAPAPASAPVPAAPAPAVAEPPAETKDAALASDDSADAAEEEDDGADEADDTPVAEEGESHDQTAPPGVDGPLYTADLSDETLAQEWKADPKALGSISFGFVDEGRLMNAEQFPRGDGWTVVSPDRAWATHETIQYVLAAIEQVRSRHPEAPPLRVNQISFKDGGYIRPHKSHQNGRDVDLGFYYPTAEPIIVREREKVMDVPLNWALVKALVTTGDVQFILVDRHVQKVLYDYALSAGEDKAWLDQLFHGGNGRRPMLMHARHHRDHFHVRFYNPRAQELGRRVAPLLAQRPEQNIAMHRVRKGDTLGAIALRYGSSVKLLQKVNRLRGSFLRISQVLKVPLRGPCTHCPVPPPVLVPARLLPPLSAPDQKAIAAVGGTSVATAPGAAPVAAAPEPAPAGVTPATATTASPATIAEPVPAAAVVPSPAAHAPPPAPAAASAATTAASSAAPDDQGDADADAPAAPPAVSGGEGVHLP